MKDKSYFWDYMFFWKLPYHFIRWCCWWCYHGDDHRHEVGKDSEKINNIDGSLHKPTQRRCRYINNDSRWVLTGICLAPLWIVQRIRRRTILQKQPPQFRRSTPLLETLASVSGAGSTSFLIGTVRGRITRSDKASNHAVC